MRPALIIPWILDVVVSIILANFLLSSVISMSLTLEDINDYIQIQFFDTFLKINVYFFSLY